MDSDYMKALVLSGGTSSGALNGALMTQKSYRKAKKIWNKLNMKVIFGEDVEATTKKDIIKMYGKQIVKGGMDVSKLEELIHKTINVKKFYKSKINFKFNDNRTKNCCGGNLLCM